MTDHASGLRFDIYERVHLDEEISGIQSLDEIELTPQIELYTRGDETLLKGYLLLKGSYTGVRSESGTTELSHRIPVEISMPSDRVANDRDIGVEIEQFDVDLLSTRTLNVTGILSLKGVESADTRPPNEQPDWNDDDMVFVHPPDPGAAGPQKEEPGTEQETDVAEPEPVYKEWRGKNDENPSEARLFGKKDREEEPGRVEKKEIQKSDKEHLNTNADTAKAETKSENTEAEKADAETAKTSETAKAGEKEAKEGAGKEKERPETAAEETETPEAEVKEPEKAQPEMKIAFSGKKTEDEDEFLQPKDVQSLLKPAQPDSGNAAPERPDVPADRQEEDMENAADPTEGHEQDTEGSGQREGAEEVEWKKLFLQREEEEPQFRKVRMCIVQKEETLDTIAERYNLNPRELLLYNRMGEQQEVREGQIIYIPEA